VMPNHLELVEEIKYTSTIKKGKTKESLTINFCSITLFKMI